MKKLPIGVENYIDVVKDCYYIDKTLIIKELLSLPATSVVLFTRPRRFGKSLMLSMINTFFKGGWKSTIIKESELCLTQSKDSINTEYQNYFYE